jgi:hypothetical protein
MKIYIQYHAAHAGKWIYSGYAHAWLYHGFEVEYIKSLEDIKEDNYWLMITDGLITEKNIKYIEKSKKTILYVSPNQYPKPWGDHPNWQCHLKEENILEINSMSNVIKWNFAEISPLCFTLWKNTYSIPLAFDNINYINGTKNNYEYDICFIGGVANNGFNEKIAIMQENFLAFIETDLKCGFYVNKNLSREQENYVILNSKVCLNIHDAYQRANGYDTNERTFKSLGINGVLISDKIDQLHRLLPFVMTSNNPKELIEYAKIYCSKSIEELNQIKKTNQELVDREHSYIKRVEKMINL